MSNEIWSIYNDKYSKYEHFTCKINRIYSHFVSVVVSGVVFRFKLALPSLLYLLKDLNTSS